jgi:hypothetical protein
MLRSCEMQMRINYLLDPLRLIMQNEEKLEEPIIRVQ